MTEPEAKIPVPITAHHETRQKVFQAVFSSAEYKIGQYGSRSDCFVNVSNTDRSNLMHNPEFHYHLYLVHFDWIDR